MKYVLRRRIIKKVKALDLTRVKKKRKEKKRKVQDTMIQFVMVEYSNRQAPSVQIFRDNDRDRVVVDRGKNSRNVHHPEYVYDG